MAWNAVQIFSHVIAPEVMCVFLLQQVIFVIALSKKKKRKPLSTTADSEERYDLILEKTNRNPKLNKLSPRAFLALSSFKPFCLVLVPFSKANSFKVTSTKLRNSIKIGQLYNFCCIKWWFLRLPWDKYAMLKRAGEKSPKCLSGKPLQQCFVQMD